MLQMLAVVTEMESISHHPRQRNDVSVHRNSVYWPEWHADGLVDFTQQWLAFYIHTYILTFTFTTELNTCPMLSHVSCTGPMCYTHFLMFAWAVLVSTMTVADTQVSVCKSSFEHISVWLNQKSTVISCLITSDNRPHTRGFLPLLTQQNSVMLYLGVSWLVQFV